MKLMIYNNINDKKNYEYTLDMLPYMIKIDFNDHYTNLTCATYELYAARKDT